MTFNYLIFWRVFNVWCKWCEKWCCECVL